MTAKPKKEPTDRVEKILDSLKKASTGDYSGTLDFASKKDDLGLIAEAVNKFLKKTGKKLPPQPPPAFTEETVRYRHILDNIEESYFEVDLKGNLTFFNDTVIRDLGYTPDEIRGIHFTRLADDANARKVYDAFHRVFTTGQPIKGFDWEILKKNGEKIYVEASVSLLRDEAGKPVGFRGIVRDVSWRIQSQKDLQKSEEKYRTILEIMDEGYIEEDLSGRITFANDAACRIMGYSREKLFSMHYRDYLTPAVADQLKKIFQRVHRTRNPERLVDYDLVRQDGSVITYEINVALKYDDSGIPCGFRILTKDVTSKKEAEEQRRKSEEKYQNILDIMGEGYIETDTRGVLTCVNDSTCKITGYPREELLGKRFDQYASPETKKEIYDTYREIFRTGKPRFMLDYGVVGKDGSVRIHQQNVALLPDESGRPKGFRILVRDVTERRKAEEALRESEAKYRNILETMEETYLETDLKGNFLFFNDSLCRVLGFSREELQNANYRLISPPENLHKIFQDFREIYVTGKTRRFSDHKLISKAGSVIYLDMAISLLRSKDGAPSGFGGFGRDVTERILAARKIEESERHLRMITDNIRDIIWTMDFNFRWTYLSPSVELTTGFSPEEVMHIPLKAMVPTEIYNMAQTALAVELEKEARGLLPNEPRMTNFELPLLHKNGSHIWVEISADFNRDESGKPFEIVGVTRDITERKRAEEKLKESEALYRKALETTSDGVSIIQDGRYVYFNERFLNTMGVPKDGLISGEPLGMLLHPEDREAILHYYEKRLRGEPTPGKHEVRVIKPDQSLMYLQVTSVDIVYQGKPALLNFMQDVTQRKKAEETLQASEKRYRAMTENVNDIVWVFDFNLRITYASPSNVRVTGFTPDEVMQMPLSDFVVPDSLKLAGKILSEELALENIGQPLDPNRSRTLQVEVYSKTGDNVWLEVNATFNRDADGKATEILAVGRNITERRNMEKALAESEKRYRMIVENMHDSISVVDLNFNFIYQSPSEIRLTGYTPEDIMSIPIREQLTPESYARAEAALALELEAEFGDQPPDPSRSITLELEAYHKNGGTIWQEANATFQRDDNGKPVGIILTTRDITARKKAEAALAASERRYRLMAENVNDMIWIINMNLEFVYISPSNEVVTGYTPEETHQIPLNRLLTAESYTRATQRLADELALENSGQPFDPQRAITIEIEAIHKEGGILYLEITGTFNRNDKGEITEILILGRDFTKRKKAEQALAESEQRYRMIVENMQDVIWIMDFNLQYKYRSPSSMRITGYTADEIMNISPKEILTTESYARAEKILTEELINEQSGLPLDLKRARTIELEIFKKDGQTAWVEVTASFNRDENGKPVEILLAVRDISARRKIEEALRESEQRYRMIAENIHGSIVLLDLNFEYQYISPSEVRMTGYTAEEIVKIPLKDQMTPESYRLVEKIISEELEREFSGRPVDPDRSRTMELEVYHKNGGTIWEELTAAFTRDKDGKPTGFLITTRNVTERKKAQEDLKKSEQRYRMIIENMHEVIWTTDLNLKTTYMSPSCFRLSGYTPEELMSLPMEQFMTPETLAVTASVVMEEITAELSGDPVDPHRSRTLAQEIIRKDGSTFWLEVTGIFIRDEQGKAIGMLMAGRDITERKKAEDEKNKLESQLMQAQKMEVVGRLAGGVAHDFNNMLSVILGYVDLAKLRLAKQHPVLTDIAEIEKAAIRSRDITTQLLAFSRKQIIEPKIIDLNDLIVHTQKAMIRLIGEDIVLKVVRSETLWAVKVDPSQIEQILINLAVNARDAMPGGGRLTIETENRVLDERYCEVHIGFTPGEYVCLSFSDNGLGMTKDILEHIFEPFFTTKEVGKGTGLGLATVYGIVKQNEGFINVYSEPGEGTTFSIYLPRASGEKEIPDDAAEEPEFEGTGHILLAEDDAMVLQIAKGMLESIGYSVITAMNPLEAIALCENPDIPIDLVISDVIMPGMSGKELRSKLAEIRPGIKVLFMSGYTADVIAHHGVLEQGVMFLQKPFTMKSLASKVIEAMAAKPI